MKDNFHYLLLAGQSMVQKELLDALKDTELTLGQPKILDFLMDHNGSNQTQIAEACHIKGASLTVVLNRMEEHKMVERRMEHGNRRTLYVYLTEYGQKLGEKVQECFVDIEEKCFAGIEDEDRVQFMETFRKVYENLK